MRSQPPLKLELLRALYPCRHPPDSCNIRELLAPTGWVQGRTVVLFLRDTAVSDFLGAPSTVRARRRLSFAQATPGALFFSTRRFLSTRVFFCTLLALVSATSACGVIKEKPPDQPDQFSVVGKEMPPEQAKEVLNEVGGNFAYGPGLGDTAVNVGTVVVFPPYAIYLLGNAVLSLSGYEPVTVASMLPEESGKQWSDTYDHIVSGPGKVVAAVSGHEYRTREVADARLRRALEAPPSAQLPEQKEGEER